MPQETHGDDSVDQVDEKPLQMVKTGQVAGYVARKFSLEAESCQVLRFGNYSLKEDRSYFMWPCTCEEHDRLEVWGRYREQNSGHRVLNEKFAEWVESSEFVDSRDEVH